MTAVAGGGYATGKRGHWVDRWRGASDQSLEAATLNNKVGSDVQNGEDQSQELTRQR